LYRYPVIALLVGSSLAACSSAASARPKDADPVLVDGSVTYDENVTLPADAAVDVWIVDVSPGVVAAAILAQTTIEAGNVRPPIPFKLRIDASRVYADHDYAIKAVIRSGGETLFEMPNEFRVLTQGRPTRVDVWVKKLGGKPAVTAPATSFPGAAPVTAPSPAPVASVPAGLAGTLWRVQDLGGESVPADSGGTLDFAEAGRIAGRAFCNRFSGQAEISGSSIRVGPLAATKMACGQAANERESRFLRALQAAERFELDGPTLAIYFAGSDRPLRFVRVQP
jgi:putative lipoprotein